MSDPVGIRLVAVAKYYKTHAGLVRAVDGITLDVPAGSSLAITGPSGCGKSTLLGLIGGLATPDEGRVFIGDRDISNAPDKERARVRREDFGFVFQSDNLLPFLTATENVSLQLALHGATEGFERSIEALEWLGLGAHSAKLPDQLSGGQRQRVAVARALIHRPRLILADEPTGSLDMDNSKAVIDLLLMVQQAIRTTVVVVTHDPEVASRMDRVVGLRDGRLTDV